MKKYVCLFLVGLLLFTTVFISGVTSAFSKSDDSRAIAIVFDNSGSMYEDNNYKPTKAWSQATYAMEVFASMLNKGDTLMIYPMHPITVGGKEYTMNAPLKITDASQAAMIRDIYTKKALATPIESIDCAAKGLQAATAAKKYMIVLTDGDYFYLGSSKLAGSRTKTELDKRFCSYAGPSMTVMYLALALRRLSRIRPIRNTL